MGESGPIDTLVDELLYEEGSARRREEVLWEEALEGLRARLRDGGALPPRRSTATHAPADAFGLDRQALESVRPVFEWLYRRWFRVTSGGHENIPREGPVVFVANHGGVLPFDAAMLIVDGLRHHGRVMRALVDRFVARIPGLQPAFAALGQVIGTRENFRGLLEAGEWVLVFPEGVAGIRKSFLSRFHLEPFHPGFVEEATRAGAPVVPVALVGQESQAPVLADLPAVAARLGLPSFPVTPTFPWLGPLGLVPLPVRYRIRYAAPVSAEALAADEPRVLAQELREGLQAMIRELRRE